MSRRVASVAVGASLRHVLAFFAYLWHRFEADQCTRAAAALAYTSLLAMVPLFTVVFVTLSAFPAFQEWRATLENLIFQNLVPALGEQVRSYLVEFTDKARGLQAAGITILVITVLLMMATIESTFNVIWGVRRRRPLLVRFLLYWLVLTLGPILIGAGMVTTSYVISLPVVAHHVVNDGLKTHLIALFPVLASTLAFVMFFKLIPYRPVPTRHALVGGVVASVLFELAKRGFAFFVIQFPSQQAIYGAFATVPIFLSWIYLSWIIVLLGAEITQCLTIFRVIHPRRHGVLGADDPLYCTFRVLLRLHEAQDHGQSLSEKDLSRGASEFGYAALNGALEILDSAGWISRNDDFEWILARDLDRLDLLDLLRLIPTFPNLEHDRATLADEADRRLQAKLVELAQWSNAALRTPLADLLSSTPSAARWSD